jgi:hypothetical protein
VQEVIVVDTSANVVLHPALIDTLRTDRESLNMRFALRQQSGARIDEAAFQNHLQTTVNSLVASVADVLPERTRSVTNALFDVSLDLFAAQLLGQTTKHPHVVTAWHEILPQAIRFLAREPLRLVGSLSNAIDNVASQSGGRPEQWIEVMRTLSPQCDSIDKWLELGKVAAWRAGLVQYRDAALRIARQLPRELAAKCMGLDDAPADRDWLALLDRLKEDPWHAPAKQEDEVSQASPRIVRETGGFRGFGGPCLRPPTVAVCDGELFVADGHARWRLLADVFGTLWHRVPDAPPNSKSPSDVSLDTAGRIRWAGATAELPVLAQSSSSACDGHTLAVTLPTSHHVFLVARVSQ